MPAAVAQVEAAQVEAVASASAVAHVVPLTTARALSRSFDYALPAGLRASIEVGSMLVVPFGRREVVGVVVGLSDRSDVADSRLLAPSRALQEGVPSELVALAEWIAHQYCSTVARALRLVLPPGPVRISTRPSRRLVRRHVHIPLGAGPPEGHELNPEQRAALDALLRALGQTGFQERLLHGVTASGKTEVYLRVAAAALERGLGTIVLVPEIALTPQTVARFVERFGETVAVLHSRMALPERREEWRRLRSGEARVCVGPRSAIFAPIADLGLIVIDEEHESSYKQEGDPRYDARAVAAHRAREAGALLLMGSATPRPETIVAARGMPEGVLLLGRRVDGRSLPPVEILDMRSHPPGLHPTTIQALAQVRRQRGRAIVLLNRRGWSNFLSCRACGRVWGCPSCEVALVLHRGQGKLACHHCGHHEALPARCPCGSTSLARHGAGTERLEHELRSAFGGKDFPVMRIDADAVDGASGPRREDAEGGAGALLRRFEQAPAGVLIGTQMVAKGHDFADLRLGVVLDADATLRFPDFRAEERTFALIAQLAGRVGRGGEGKVLVQTIAPDARAIVDAARHDTEGFLAGELERRRQLGYPPYRRLVRIICSADRSADAASAAAALRRELDERLSGIDASVLGPAELMRLRGRERMALVIKADPDAPTLAAVDETVRRLAGTRPFAKVSSSVDVDPQ